MARRYARKSDPVGQKTELPEPVIVQTQERKLTKERLALVVGAAGLVISLVVYILRLDKVVGLIGDDAWYVLLAKALATGQGYTLVNSPSSGIQPFYAPGFPALLSIFYRLSPHFPGNVWLLKSVSVAAMMGTGVVAYSYFRRERELPLYTALGLAAAIVLYPALVFLATSTVMSECVFTLTLLAAVTVIERGVRRKDTRAAMLYMVAGGALASFAFLTRPAGVGLLVAAVAYLVRAKLLRQALVFAASVALLAGPWLLYSRLHAPTAEQRAEQGGNIVQGYSTQVWQRVAGQPLSGTITLGDMPDRIWANISEIARFDIGAVAFYPFFRPLEPGERMVIEEEFRMFSIFLTILALAGFAYVVWWRLTLAEIVVPLSLLVTLTWGWEQFRLILPLVPFLLFYLLMGLRVIVSLHQRLNDSVNERAGWLPLTLAVWLSCALSLYSNVGYLLKKNSAVSEKRLLWVGAFEENEALIRFVGERVPGEAIIATQNPALLHLYTGHKTIAADNPAASWERWNKLGVGYLARTSAYPLPADPAENKYQTIYRSDGRLNLRVLDLGPPSSRAPWGSK
ncbi:MAG TPA: hypothetical protein VFD58_37535 [Blastocatellia bacterium]|nr:hypothetical protein [Blastocatellia bacterium]